MKRSKNYPGGQKGNQNARTHGFYSQSFTREEADRFRKIMQSEKIDPDMAVLRVKLQSLALNSPDDPELPGKIHKLVVKELAKKFKVSRAGLAHLKVLVKEEMRRQYLLSCNTPEQMDEPSNQKNESASFSLKTNSNTKKNECDLADAQNEG